MKAVTLVQVHPRQPSKHAELLLQAPHRPCQVDEVVTARYAYLVRSLFFSIGWIIAGNAARDIVGGRRRGADGPSIELNDYFGDAGADERSHCNRWPRDGPRVGKVFEY